MSTSRKIQNFIIKKTSYTWFRSDCQDCISCNRCMSATSLGLSKIDYLLYIRGFKRAQTEAMRKGKEEHEELLASYKTVEEYGPKLIRNNLLAGEEIRLSEVKVCSKKFGYRGVMDLLRTKMTESVVDFDIYEIKHFVSKKYLKQVAVYGTILSDRDFEIIYRERGKRKEKRLGLKILPDIPLNMNINIFITTPQKTFKIEWMKNNQLTEYASGFTKGILKESKEKRKLHNANIYMLPDLDKNIKERQLFFGKRKIIKKSRPRIKL